MYADVHLCQRCPTWYEIFKCSPQNAQVNQQRANREKENLIGNQSGKGVSPCSMGARERLQISLEEYSTSGK